MVVEGTRPAGGVDKDDCGANGCNIDELDVEEVDEDEGDNERLSIEEVRGCACPEFCRIIAVGDKGGGGGEGEDVQKS